MGALSFPIEFMSNSGGVTEAALAAIDAWDSTAITASTYSAVAGEARVFTHATGCDVTLPTGASNGMMIAVRTGHATGYVKFVTGGGSSKVQTGTTQIVGLGKVMVAQATANANEWVVVGADPLEPRFLGYYATYADLLGDYAVSSAEITALNAGDWAWVTAYGQRFVPNVAKTRMVAESRLIKLGSLAGTVASPIATVSGATSGQFSLTEPELPAYLAQAGDYIQVYALARKQNANATVLVKCRLGTAGTVADQGISEVTITNVINNDAVMQNTIAVLSNTGLSSTKSIIRQSSAGAANQNTPSTDMTALQYFSMHVESGHASDVYVLTHFAVYLEQAL